MSKQSDDLDKKLKAASAVLGEPIFIGFDQKMNRTKTTLFLVSLICIIYLKAGLVISGESSFLGLKFHHINDQIFQTILLITVSYLFINFIWNSIDTFSEWRLRITGMKTTYSHPDKQAPRTSDFPSDPRQSTLYSWWQENSERIGNLEENVEFIKNEMLEIHVEIKTGFHPKRIENLEKLLSKIDTRIINLNNTFQKTNEILTSERIPLSLLRFDKYFHFLLKSQNVKWILLEFLLPTVTSIWAFSSLVSGVLLTK